MKLNEFPTEAIFETAWEISRYLLGHLPSCSRQSVNPTFQSDILYISAYYSIKFEN